MRLRLPRPATQQALALWLTASSSIAWVPGVGSAYLRFAFTLAAGASWLLIWATGSLERVEGERRILLGGLAVAGLAVVLSSLLAASPSLALTFGGSTGLSAPYWIALLLIMGGASRVTLSRPTLNAIRWQFAWAVPVGLIGMAQSILTGQVTFGFGNADYFAPMMLLFMPIAFGLAHMSTERGPLWRMAGVFFMVAAVSARTLSGLIGLAAVVLFALWFAPDLLGIRGTLRRVLIVALVACALVFFVFGIAYVADLMPPPVEHWTASTVLGGSAATRIEMWRAGMLEWRDHLLVGVGPDGYSFAGQRYFSRRMHILEHYPTPDNELPMDPHSLIVLLPTEFGILGVIAVLIIGFGWARGVLRPAFRSEEGHLLRWSFALGALGFGYTTIFIPFPLYFGGLPLAIAGLALVRAPEPRPWPTYNRWARPRVAVALLGVAVAAAVGSAAVIGWEAFREAPLSPNDTSGMSQAIRVQPQVAYYRFAVLWQRGRMLTRSHDPEAYLRFQRAVDSAPVGVRRFAPYLVELVRLSLLDARDTGRTNVSWERARLADAVELSPSLPEAQVEYIHLEIVIGHWHHARERLEAASEWRDVVPEYREYEQMVTAHGQQ